MKKKRYAFLQIKDKYYVNHQKQMYDDKHIDKSSISPIVYDKVNDKLTICGQEINTTKTKKQITKLSKSNEYHYITCNNIAKLVNIIIGSNQNKFIVKFDGYASFNENERTISINSENSKLDTLYTYFKDGRRNIRISFIELLFFCLIYEINPFDRYFDANVESFKTIITPINTDYSNTTHHKYNFIYVELYVGDKIKKKLKKYLSTNTYVDKYTFDQERNDKLFISLMKCISLYPKEFTSNIIHQSSTYQLINNQTLYITFYDNFTYNQSSSTIKHDYINGFDSNLVDVNNNLLLYHNDNNVCAPKYCPTRSYYRNCLSMSTISQNEPDYWSFQLSGKSAEYGVYSKIRLTLINPYIYNRKHAFYNRETIVPYMLKLIYHSSDSNVYKDFYLNQETEVYPGMWQLVVTASDFDNNTVSAFHNLTHVSVYHYGSTTNSNVSNIKDVIIKVEKGEDFTRQFEYTPEPDVYAGTKELTINEEKYLGTFKITKKIYIPIQFKNVQAKVSYVVPSDKIINEYNRLFKDIYRFGIATHPLSKLHSTPGFGNILFNNLNHVIVYTNSFSSLWKQQSYVSSGGSIVYYTSIDEWFNKNFDTFVGCNQIDIDEARQTQTYNILTYKVYNEKLKLPATSNIKKYIRYVFKHLNGYIKEIIDKEYNTDELIGISNDYAYDQIIVYNFHVHYKDNHNRQSTNYIKVKFILYQHKNSPYWSIIFMPYK